MSGEIRVPVLGESIVDAVIATWLKHEGDIIKQGDALVELETDKINLEVNAEQNGILQRIAKKEGETVAVGDVIGTIGENAQVEEKVAKPGEVTSTEIATELMNESVSATGQRSPTPLARRIAAEHKVDISQVQSSHGRVTKDDVIQFLEHSNQPGTATSSENIVSEAVKPATMLTIEPKKVPETLVSGDPREERVRLSRRRQTIAQRLVEAQHTAAMLTTFNEIDMSVIMDIRARRKEAFKEKHNVSLGFMSFFTKAVISALKAYPRLNAEIHGSDMILKYHYDIGIAVGVEEGLVVPVVRDADRKSFADIEREIADLAKKAKAGSLSLAELQGGTFTITNGGTFGSLMSTPILNGPQVGILGMHKIEQRAVVVGEEIVIRPMMYIALSYDHRIVDGSEAVRFLVKVKELLEDSEALLLEG